MPDVPGARELRRMLAEADLRPAHRLGQNFLVDRRVLERILAVSDVQPDEGVLEVGAGLGVLTAALAERAGTVVSIEIDRRFKPHLEALAERHPHLELVFGDALDLDWAALCRPDRSWKFVANVPYYVTAPLLAKALAHTPPFTRLVMMVQWEVAERLRAAPGEAAYSAVSVLAAYYADVTVVQRVRPESFWPRPKVDSAIVLLVPRARSATMPDPEQFFPVVRAAFGRRRKTLRNALTGDPHLRLTREQAEQALAAAGIDPQRRGETLSLEAFAALAAAVASVREAST